MVGVPISLQTAGGAGDGIISFIPSGVGCYILGNNLFATNAGFCGVIAKKDGDATYNPFFSQYVQFNFEGQSPGTLTISNTNLVNPVGTSISLTTSGGNGNPVTKFSTANASCKIEGNVLTATKRTSCYVVATQGQWAQFKYTNSTALGFDFGTSQETLRITPAGTTLDFGKSVSISTIGGSGLGEVSLKVNGSGCILDGNSLSAKEKTSCVVIAKKASDETYYEVVSKYEVFNFVNPPLLNQSPITISASAQTLNVGQNAILGVAGGSGTGALTFKVTGAGCTLTGSTITSNSPTSCVILAKKGSDSKYLELTSNYVVVTFIAVPKPIDNSKLTFALNVQQTEAATSQRIKLGTIGGPVGVVSYSVTSGTCQVSDSYLATSSPTSCTVVAILKPNDLTIKSVVSAPLNFTFTNTTSALVINNPTLTGAVGQTLNLSTAGGNGNPVSFSVTSGNTNNCLIEGATLKALSATSCTVTAIQNSPSGSTTVISTPVTFTFSFAPAKIAQNPIILDVTNSNSVANTSIPLIVRGGSGTGALGFAVTGPGCSIQNTAVVADRVTTCSVVASKEGDTQYSKIYAAYGLFKFGYATQPTFTIANAITAFSLNETVTVQTQGGTGSGSVTIKEIDNNPKCSIDSSKLTVRASEATTCRIVATKSSDQAYSPANSQTIIFTFRKP